MTLGSPSAQVGCDAAGQGAFPDAVCRTDEEGSNSNEALLASNGASNAPEPSIAAFGRTDRCMGDWNILGAELVCGNRKARADQVIKQIISQSTSKRSSPPKRYHRSSLCVLYSNTTNRTLLIGLDCKPPLGYFLMTVGALLNTRCDARPPVQLRLPTHSPSREQVNRGEPLCAEEPTTHEAAHLFMGCWAGWTCVRAARSRKGVVEYHNGHSRGNLCGADEQHLLQILPRLPHFPS